MITFSFWEMKYLDAKKKKKEDGTFNTEYDYDYNYDRNEHFARTNIITKEKESMKVKGWDFRRNNKEAAPQPCRPNCDEGRTGRKNVYNQN